MTQLVAEEINAIGAESNTIAPLNIKAGDLGTECTASAEALEGLLVTISNAKVVLDSELNGDISTVSNQILIDDGSGVAEVRRLLILDQFVENSSAITLKKVTGNVGYSYNRFEIRPRSSADIVVGETTARPKPKSGNEKSSSVEVDV